MKKFASTICTMILVLVVSATTFAKSGIIPTTKAGSIPTTKAGLIPTTKSGSIPTTKTNTGIIPTMRTRSTQTTDQFSLMELFWAVFGW